MGLVLDLVLLAGDVAIGSILYNLISMNKRRIDCIQKAPTVAIDSGLMKEMFSSDNNELPYVCIEGCVTATNEALKSKFSDDMLGVVKTNKIYELKSTRTKGFWHDTKDLIHDTVTIVPFVLTSNERATKHDLFRVHISDPLMSDYLIDNLRETHNSFEQNTSSGISRGIDRIFGDVTKGYEEIETMLPIGSALLGMGKLVVENRELLLKRPDVDSPYILTLLTRANIVKAMENHSLVYKILLGSFTVLGIGFLYMTLKHAYEKYLTYKQTRAAVEFYRRIRADGGQDVDANVENMCVICLSSPRQVVLLDCGHICLCQECSENLPEPAQCPICRGVVSRRLPVYVP